MRDPQEPGAAFDVHTDRVSYRAERLVQTDFAAVPHEQFAHWLQDAARAGVPEPNAMVVGTADADGRVSTRTVLLRGFSENGFDFYTNYEGRKGQQLAQNPFASACFPWIAQHRQVIVTGSVRRMDASESDDYFASRPRGSQLASSASPQSQVIASLTVVQARMHDLEEKYPDPSAIPRPNHWGGFRIEPETVEFWQGNENRLHDRLRYRRSVEGNGDWVIERLAP